MRAERLLRLLLHLQTHQRTTVQQLATQLGASARTIQRDLDALSLAGVPIYSQRGRGGGWQLLPDYRTRLTGLTPAEAIAVFVGATAHVLADLGVDASSGTAMDKLLATLPGPTRQDATFARQRLLIDHGGWNDATRKPRWLDLCRQALWGENYLDIIYRNPLNPMRIAPLGLVAKTRTWYLVAQRQSNGAKGAESDGHHSIRTYRLDRITQAELTDDHFTRPRDFNLADHWAATQQRFRSNLPSYLVTLRVREHALHRITVLDATGADADGWCTVETDLENVEEAIARVLALAGDAIATAPDELVTEIRHIAKLICSRH